MGRQVIVEMARSFGVTPSRYDGGDRLADPDYRRLIDSLTESGVRWTTHAEAQDTLAALRATYEPLLDALAARLLLKLPPWMGSGERSDNWQAGHRGLIASRLIEQLSSRGQAPPDTPLHDMPGEGSLSHRLRAQLDRE
ncbi:MAG: hypothetical protein ACRYHQ_11185, partial [Janthinobacterium lividum]